MPAIIELYSDYHRKKWFPDKYPDPMGELVDYINEAAIRDLFQKQNPGMLQIAFELVSLLPKHKFPDLHRDFTQAYQESLTPAGCRPEFCYFYLRRLTA